MASAKKILALILLMTSLIGISVGAVHQVGDFAGWTIMGNVDYNKWASSKTFHVGDSILFEYSNQFHNVKQVSLQDFQSCNAASPIATFTTGFDSISLERPGHYYFLCGFPGHCEAGQKLDIMVSPASLRPSASPRSSAAPYYASSVPSSSQPLPKPDESNNAPSGRIFYFTLSSTLICSAIFLVGLAY